ncbi:unnamed protein product [Tenebrio molitor]|nr:unnamed protein product [Tenebrio molitor]
MPLNFGNVPYTTLKFSFSGFLLPLSGPSASLTY